MDYDSPYAIIIWVYLYNIGLLKLLRGLITGADYGGPVMGLLGGAYGGWRLRCGLVCSGCRSDCEIEKTKNSICRFSLAVRRTLLHTPPHLDRDSAATSDL